MCSHRQVLGRYTITGRVLDLMFALGLVAIMAFVMAEIFVPGGAGKLGSVSSQAGTFMIDAGTLLVVLGIVLIIAISRLARRSRRLTNPPDALPQEEADLLRDIHGRLSRMEQRIDALETLLLDGRRSDAARVR